MTCYRSLLLSLLMLVILLPSLSHAKVERRKDQFGKDFGYYVYPIAGEIPGLGVANGAGASVLNMGGTDADITGYYLEGDFEAKGVALLDLQWIPRRLIFDVAYNGYFVAPISYQRGLDSDPDQYIQPKAEGQYLLGQVTLSFYQRRYEAFLRALGGKERLHAILDADGNAFADVDSSWNHSSAYFIGGSVDWTDDRLDPREGLRLETSFKLPEEESSRNTEFMVADVNYTHFVPMRQWDTLVFNLYGSHALVTRKGETDKAAVQAEFNLGCDALSVGPEQDACLSAERTRVQQIMAHRRYGTASPLGGTQRLRSFNNYRFYASKTLFYGAEYRWNLTNENTPFDIFIAKGIRTGIQLAAFWERGSVSDGYRELLDRGVESYGLGFRVVLSGVVIRFDMANGSEGAQSQLFITYPWSMFSVDNPG
ncbi:MAG: hypothetical protein OEW58_09460 [Gammaproteobacteria bacterium]|nr:hypothetical protein [Gammaproteobacteria bacterium]